MKHFFTIIFILTAAHLNYAQSIHPSLISNGGAISFGGDVKVDWSIGEIAVISHESSIHLTEGFHQGEDIKTSVYSFENVDKFKLYPNPNQGILNIEGQINKIKSIEIYDPLGSKLMTITEIESSIYLDHLNPGLYLIQCNLNNDQFEIHKIIKI